MKLQTTAGELAGVLRRAMGAVVKGAPIPILSHFLLVAQDGLLTVTSSNTEMELSVTCEAVIKEAGQAVVTADKLAKLTAALPADAKVTLEATSDKAMLRSGKNRYKLAVLDPDDFPVIPDVGDAASVTLPAEVLAGLLGSTAYAMAVNDVRYYLNGALFAPLDGKFRCVATDGHRLSVCTVPLEGLRAGNDLIIPRSAVAEIAKLAAATKGDVVLSLAEKHLRVTAGPATLTTAILDGRFPDYGAVIPSTFAGTVELDRAEFLSAVKRVAILADEKFRGLHLDVDDDILTIAANGSGAEEATERVPIEACATSVSIGLNSTFLIAALSALEGERVCFGFNDGTSPCGLRETQPGSARGMHVVMPLRL